MKNILFVVITTGILFIFATITSDKNKAINLTYEEVNSIVFSNSCSTTSYCADGFTLNGIDRLGNPRGYIYPKKTISQEDYIASVKKLDYEGYDKYGFDILGNNKSGANFKEFNTIIY